jgi:multidrug resistance efflux pump
MTVIGDNIGLTSRLVTLLDLEGQVLAAGTRQEVAFCAVNLSHALAPYRQAMLWSAKRGIEAVSGLALPESNAPFMLWSEQVFRALAKGHDAMADISASDLPAELAEQWDEWLPAHGLFLPLAGGALLFARDEPWDEGGRMLLKRLTEGVRAALRGFERPSPFAGLLFPRVSPRRKHAAIAAAVVLAAAFPVTGSVLAPAEMVPAGPAVVRSPLEGVVDRIHVKPNDAVTEGQPLFDLDTTQIAGKLQVVRQQYATADAEHRQVQLAQFNDPKMKAQVAILAGKAEEKAAEVKWLESQLDRVHVKAPRAGIAVFDDPSEWIGRPVAVGEKVIQVAAETDTDVEAWVAVPDVGEVKPGAKLTLFLNTRPLSPVRAVVRTVAYEAVARPDGTIAHRLRATVAEGGDKPRLGLKGTSRIDGDTVPLVWWLFRKPLAAVRQFVGV